MSFLFKCIHKIYKIIHPELGRILMLHRVVSRRSTLDENRKIEVSPAFLERTILSYKRHHYEFVSLDEAIVRIKSGRKKRKFVCFTLDDGYVDVYNNAYPIFQKYACPFALSITTDFCEQKAFLWWYKIEKVIVDNDMIFLSDGSQYDVSDMEKKNRAFCDLRDRIFKLSNEKLETTIRCWFEKYNIDDDQDLFLSKEQLLDMSQSSLCTIASHTISHPFLPGLEYEKQFEELAQSKERLERLTGKPVLHFAYPYGAYDENTLLALKESGYASAMITYGGAYREKTSETYALKRMELHEQ